MKGAHVESRRWMRGWGRQKKNRRTKTKTTNLTVRDVVILNMQKQEDMTSLIM